MKTAIKGLWLSLAAMFLAGPGLCQVPVVPQALPDFSDPFAGKAGGFESNVPAVGEAKAVPAAKKAPAPLPTPGPRVEPDWSFTPGRLCTQQDPDFDEFRYAEHIAHCKRVVTDQMKQEVAAHYGVPQAEWKNYEFDHLIPLAIGGNTEVVNLWPQPHGFPDGSNGKDKLESRLYWALKKGTMTQSQALEQIKLWFEGQSMVDGHAEDPLPPGPNPAD